MSRMREAAGAQRGSEDVPAEVADILRGLPIDAGEFSAWLGPRLGLIRAQLAHQDSQPSRADKRKTMKDLAAHVDALRELLDIGGLAISERAMLRGAAHRRRTDFAGLIKRMRADLREMEEMTAVAQRAIDDEAAVGGKPPMSARDAFLVEVGAKLRPAFANVEDTAAYLERILIACRIPAPGQDTIARKLYGS